MSKLSQAMGVDSNFITKGDAEREKLIIGFELAGMNPIRYYRYVTDGFDYFKQFIHMRPTEFSDIVFKETVKYDLANPSKRVLQVEDIKAFSFMPCDL